MEFQQQILWAEEQMRAVRDRSFILKPGVGQVLFSAPHCVEQTRNGKPKLAEYETGLLVEMLHRELGCPIIRKVENRNDDANYDPVSDYKEALAAYVKEQGIAFVMDLHQLAPHRDVMINFGTGDGKNLSDKAVLNVFLSVFSGNRIGSIQLDEPFGATYDHTVSATIHRLCGIPCMQIEINSRLVHGEDNALETVYACLQECYRQLTVIYEQR